MESLERWGLGPKSEWDDARNKLSQSTSALALKCALLSAPIPGHRQSQSLMLRDSIRKWQILHAKEAQELYNIFPLLVSNLWLSRQKSSSEQAPRMLQKMLDQDLIQKYSHMQTIANV